ncbi:MAG: hypothetical protein LC104_04235 [Bacteroidales bacterium]|nr:hypothetical protein [Bacteroidales bacterium]
MPIKVTCPKCGGVLHAPDDSAGKRGRCPTCQTVLTIPTQSPPPSGEHMPAHGLGQPSPVGVGGGGSGGLAQTPGGGFRPGLVETTGVAPAPGRNLPPPGVEARPAPGTYTFQEPEPRPGPSPRLPPPAAPTMPAKPRVPEPNRQTLAPPTADDEPQDRQVRGWKRVRRGLGLIRFATLFAFLAPVACAGLIAYEQYGSPLPTQPGLLPIPSVDLAQEIRIAVVAVPVLLSVLCTLLGRLSMARAPRASLARGLLQCSALATIFAIAGLVIAGFPMAVEFSEGTTPTDWMPAETQAGVFQRFGLTAGLVLSILAECWFLAAVSKIGAALHHRPTASRSGGLLILGGLLLLVASIAAVGYQEYLGTIEQWWNQYAQEHWEKVGVHQPIARVGAVVVIGFFVAVLYLRMVGAGCRATRDWFERNAPA